MKRNCVLVLAMSCMSLVTVDMMAQRPHHPCPGAPDGRQVCPLEEPEATTVEPAERPMRAARPAEIYSPETRAMIRADRMAAELELTDDVKQKLVELFIKEEKARDKHKAEVAEQRAKQREEWKNEMDGYNAEMEKILGSENMQKLREIREKKAPERQFRHENCPKQGRECPNAPK